MYNPKTLLEVDDAYYLTKNETWQKVFFKDIYYLDLNQFTNDF